MSTKTRPRATVADLRRYPGKAELVNGRIEPRMPTSRKPNRVAGRIFKRLDDYVEMLRLGEAYIDNMGFTVPMLPSGRESFSPNVSFYRGPFTGDDMRFIKGAPTFAVEVRSESDYDASAETEMADKRVDYFAAGTLVVWDVDPVNELIHVYRAANPTMPTTYRNGDLAEAEPALPGWRLPVAELFP